MKLYLGLSFFIIYSLSINSVFAQDSSRVFPDVPYPKINLTDSTTLEIFKESEYTGFSTSNFIYLHSNQTIYSNSVTFHNKLIGKRYIATDNETYESSEVKFFKNENGFYGSFKGVIGQPYFIKRTSTGRLNVYKIKGSSGTNQRFNHATGQWTGGSGGSRPKYFYNKGTQDLKRLTNYNLKKDLISNPDAMKYVSQARAVSIVEYSLISAGSFLMLKDFLK